MKVRISFDGDYWMAHEYVPGLLSGGWQYISNTVKKERDETVKAATAYAEAKRRTEVLEL